MEIIARSVAFTDDGYCTVLSFADDPGDPKRFAILQITNRPTAQDLQLRQGGIYLELGGQKLNGYDLIKSIDAKGNEISLIVEDNGAQRAGGAIHVRIKLESSMIDGMTTTQALEPFKQRLRPSVS